MDGKKVRNFTLGIFIGVLLLISTPFFPQRINNILKLVLEIFIVILLFSNKKIIKKAFFTSIPAIIFLIASLYSTFRWTGFSTRVLNAFVTNFAVVIFYYLFYAVGKEYDRTDSLKIIRRLFLFITIIMDFFTIITFGKGVGHFNEAIYLLGNKFMLSYLHMIVLSSMVSDSKTSIFKIFLYYIYSFLIFRIADTTTGVIGITVILLILYFSRKHDKIISFLAEPKNVLIFFLILNFLFLLTNTFFSNEIISNFFLKYSHTDTLLSGRLPMYTLVMKEMQKSYLFGFGINYDIVYLKYGFGNPQNGILKLLLDYGIVGTSIFCIMLYHSFKNLKKCNDKKFILFIVLYVYGMLVCSLVEINLDLLFMIILAIGNGISFDNNLSNEKKV